VTPVDKSNEPLDAILRRAMSERPGPATPECADAESLAAYSDRSLPAPERKRLETHFADCTRCQVLLADITRADESARETKAASEIPWYRRWRIAIPALAAVAAVVVFVSMRRPTNDQSQTDQLGAMAKNEAPAAELSAKTLAVTPAAPAAVPAAPSVAQAPPVAAAASNEIAMNEPRALAAPRAEAMVPGARAMVAQGGAAPKAEAMQAYGAAGAGSAPVAGSAAASNAGYTMQAGVLATIPSSDRSVTWIVGKNGTIRRLDANGGSRSLQSGVSTDLVAGAAPSSSVCWVVGRGGTILRTTDGEHWSAVPAPSAEDLVAVSAGSANDATITTSSSKTFATSDGGATWHQQ
jgi:hypothetical protein